MKKKHQLKCVGCRKPIKTGEFVVLNGGALTREFSRNYYSINRKALGFLTVNNHFDSAKNYRSFMIAVNTPGGQFEFYACSHECLASFLKKSVMHLKEIDEAIKYKKIKIAPSKKVMALEEWCNRTVAMMGFRGALVTDESKVYDFFEWGSDPEKQLKRINRKLGFEVKEGDYIWRVAKRLAAAWPKIQASRKKNDKKEPV